MDRSITTISANDYAAEALRVMTARGQSKILVLERDEVVGVVSASDLQRMSDASLKDRDVREFMATRMLAIHVETQLQEAERLLRLSGLDFLTVVKDAYPVGIVNKETLFAAYPYRQAS